MARYIDADKLIAHLEDEIEGCKPPFNSRANGKSIAYGTVLGLKSAISFAKTLPPADVVPKSEVYGFTAEELAQKCESLSIELEAMRTSANSYKMHYEKARQEVAREIFDNVEKIILENTYPYFDKDGKPCNIWKAKSGYDALAELKKKYTESEGKG